MSLFSGERSAPDQRSARTKEILAYAAEHGLPVVWRWNGVAGASSELVPEIEFPRTSSASLSGVTLQNLIGERRYRR